MKTDEKIRLYPEEKIRMFPDQFASLGELSPLLPKNKRSVLLALIAYIDPAGTLNSYATQAQIKTITRLSRRTICSITDEFHNVRLLYKQRITNGQNCYYFYLPVAESVFEFYREAQNRKRSKNGRQTTVPSIFSNTVTNAEPPVDAVKPTTMKEKSTPGTSTVRPIPTNDESLDPDVAALIDELRRKMRLRKNGERSVPIEFLTSVGAATFQVDYEDEDVWIREDKLFEALKERRANSMEGFRKQVTDFSKIPKEFWCPRITLKASEKIMSVIDETLKDYPEGRTWLREQIYRQRDPDDDPSISYMESEIRLWLIKVMVKNRTRTLDNILDVAKQKDNSCTT